MSNLIDFHGKKILVTGASSGIGRETAIFLNNLGASVIMIARREENLKQIMNGLEGEENRYYVFDLRNISGIANLIKEIIKENGPLNGFAGCAGESASRPLNLMDYEYMRGIMDVNYFSFIEIVRQITKKNAYMPGLSIVGISSISAMQGIITETAYASSKAAMNMAVRCLSRELGRKKIRINTVAPGFIGNTGISESIMQSENQTSYLEKLLEKQTLGMGKPSDIANVIAYLLSDMSSFVTGATILADGGTLA